MHKNLPNLLSLSRVVFLFIITLLLFSNIKYKHMVSLVLMIIGSITDFLDGYTARKYNAVSKFGILFDAIADKIMTVGIFVTFIAIQIYPKWFVFPILVVLSREFLMSGLRMIAAKEQIVLAAEKSGKIKTAVQMVSMCISVGALGFEEIKTPQIIVSGLVLLGQITFIVSSILAFTSGVEYFMKYGYLFTESTKPQTDKQKSN